MGVGSGDLPKEQKYVVLLEFYGGARLSDTRKLKKSLTDLLKKYKGTMKENVSAHKRKGDPRQGWVKGFNPPTPEDINAGLKQKRKKPR